MIDLKKIPNGGIWIPSKKSSNWLLITLHGSGGSSKDFSGLDEIFQIPELNYLYLNGPIKDYGGFRWYSDPSLRSDAYNTIQQALEYANAVGFPYKQIFLMGFSQGAALSIEFGASYLHLLAGYIGISGRIENLPGLISFANPEIKREGRWLITHGSRDYNLSVDIMRSQVEQLKHAGWSIEYREYDKIHEFDSKNELPDIAKWIHMKLA